MSASKIPKELGAIADVVLAYRPIAKDKNGKETQA
jgi:hypothetical protein